MGKPAYMILARSLRGDLVNPQRGNGGSRMMMGWDGVQSWHTDDAIIEHMSNRDIVVLNGNVRGLSDTLLVSAGSLTCFALLHWKNNKF